MFWCTYFNIFFSCLSEEFYSSPELKAQMSYSNRPSSVCLFVCLSLCKLLHFRLLLQNYWANTNQTWHKSFLGEGDSF
jgi:hypothetical protein